MVSPDLQEQVPWGFDEPVGCYRRLRVGDNLPAFVLRDWRTFADANCVAFLEGILWIVSPVLFGLTDGFLQNGV